MFCEKEDKLSNLDKKLRLAFNKIKQEFSDHLDSINQNTNEIQANYEYLKNLDDKIEKLNERIDEIAMFLGIKKDFDFTFEAITSLTKEEKEVFLTLYSLTEENEFVTYKDIAKTLRISVNMTMNYITNILEKGVPIIKKYNNNTVLLKINPHFRQMQTKKNLLNITQSVSQKLLFNFID
jgi:DNA-binding CsgD family transcriptional regulator